MHSLRATLARLATMSDYGVAVRLYLGFGLLLLLMTLVGTMGWFATGTLAQRTQGLVDGDHHRSTIVARMEMAVSEMALSVTSMSLTEDAEDVKYEVQRLLQGIKAYDDASAALEASMREQPDAAQEATLASIQDVRLAAVGLMQQIASKASAGTSREAIADFTATQVRPPQDAWFKGLAALHQGVDAQMQEAARQSQSMARRVQAALAGAVLLALVLGVVGAWLIARSVSHPLAEAVDMARAVAQGDLSASLSTNRRDEIGALLCALGDMQNSLRRIVGDIRSAADSIQTASSEVASGNADLSQRTETTAAHLQQAAASMQQLTGNLQQSTGAAASADGLAAGAAQAAERGGAVVQEVVGNMAAIADSSRRIADITGVIDGIAFQTNLLALNAAVEAARAGEQGRGFAVVAGEVRSLAQRAGAAAKEIKSLIGASVERVESGGKLVRGAGQTMSEIVGSVRRVAGAVAEIRAAAQEQNRGINDLTAAVGQVDTMTQQNAALVEQSSAAANLLAEQAARLNALIGTFRLSPH